jgi:hypothetical protein
LRPAGEACAEVRCSSPADITDLKENCTLQLASSFASAGQARLDPTEEAVSSLTFPIFRMAGAGVTALADAADPLETMVANYMAEGWDLPKPSPARGRPVVRLAPLVAAKAEVYRAMRQAGIDKTDPRVTLGADRRC